MKVYGACFQEKFVVEIWDVKFLNCPFCGQSTVLMRVPVFYRYIKKNNNNNWCACAYFLDLQGHSLIIIEEPEAFNFACAESWHIHTH